jgi:hypothetical protein
MIYEEIYETSTDSVQKKKPGLLIRWLLNLVKDAVEYEQIKVSRNQRNHHPGRGIVAIDDSDIDLDREKSIRFNVYNASGGRVVETSRFDRTKDRNITNLYVITSEQEFGKEIDKIITLEHLKQ